MLNRDYLHLFYPTVCVYVIDDPRFQSATSTSTPTLSMPSAFRVIPTTQRYDWGKRGSKSRVAQLAVASKLPGFQLDENAPYAEVILVCNRR